MPTFYPRIAIPSVILLSLLSAAASAQKQGAETPKEQENVAEEVLASRREHLTRLGVAGWHEAGFTGKGIKIAILDSGFRGYKEHLGKALPTTVTSKSFRFDANLEARDSQHGILCAEVIHSLAPEAELVFANWETDDPKQFLEAVRWVREYGARVISCSVIMPAWSDGEGGGETHKELAKILGNGTNVGDVLFFACAGNTALRHWTGKFANDGKSYHQWQTGKVENLLTPYGKERVTIEVCWKPGAHYLVEVVNGNTGKVIADSSTSKDRDERLCAVVHFQPEQKVPYSVRVRLVDGEPGTLHCYALHASLETASAAGSVCFPGDGAETIAIGAVDREGKRLAYSSCGPNSTQPKPDLMAPVPFPSTWRAKTFSGTSAAAPQAAAMAALCWSRQRTWSAEKIKKTLLQCARDLNTPGHDFETGYGLIQTPKDPVLTEK